MRKIYSLLFISFSVFTLANAQALKNAGSITVQSDGTNHGFIYVNGDVEITSTGSIENNGIIEVKGDWANNRTNGDVTYNGTGAGIVRFTAVGDIQQISSTGATGEVAFHNMETTNPLAITSGVVLAGVSALDNIRVNGTLTLNNAGLGMLTHDLIIGLDGEITGYNSIHNPRFTTGSFVKKIATGRASEVHNFPYYKEDGNTTYGDNYLPVDIRLNTAPAQADEIRVKFVPTANLGNMFFVGGCNGQNIMLNQTIPDFGYWEIDVEDAANNNLDNTAGWYYDLTVYPSQAALNNMATSFGSDYFKMLRIPSHSGNSQIPFNPSTAPWDSYVGTSGTFCNGLAEIATYNETVGVMATAMSNFSRFGGGGNSGGAGLPIELLSLEANPIDNDFIQVEWSTAVEIDNAGFEVLRSTDGQTFERIGWVDGNGSTTTESEYAFDDRNVIPNQVYYYRLNQIDFDGASEETYIVSASITVGDVFSIGEFVPNPTLDNSHINITSGQIHQVEVIVFNTLGQIVMDNKHEINPGVNRIDFDMTTVADGTYHAIIKVDNEIYNRKLVLTK